LRLKPLQFWSFLNDLKVHAFALHHTRGAAEKCLETAPPFALLTPCPNTLSSVSLSFKIQAMTDKRFTVLDLIDIDLKEHNSLNLHCIGGRKGLTKEISIPDLNRPGLALAGFYDSFAYQRIQLFGRGAAQGCLAPNFRIKNYSKGENPANV
jgi:hypothetical protein